MDAAQQRAVLTICLMAAVADGDNDDREREAIAESLGAQGGVDVAALARGGAAQKPDLASVAAALTHAENEAARVRDGGRRRATPTARRRRPSASSSPASRRRSGLPRRRRSSSRSRRARSPRVPPSSTALDGALVAAVPANDADLDTMILNYSILNGALELLPQSLASMAIIPLQMRMVYRIGKAHGFELDSGHIKDLLATLGVGLTSQYLEQFGRKLVGGLLGKIGGGLLGGLGSATTGAAFSFATTYALGEVAKRYYAGGRTIDAAGLQQAFADMLASAKTCRASTRGRSPSRRARSTCPRCCQPFALRTPGSTARSGR